MRPQKALPCVKPRRMTYSSDVKTEFFSQPIIGLPLPVFYR